MADNYSLVKRASESNFDHHKRLVYGKLVDKTLADCDYSELAEALYGQPYSSDVARRMLYGSRKTLELLDTERIKSVSVESVRSDIDAQILELRKERKKFYDQRREYNKLVDNDSRREHLEAALIEAANKLDTTVGSLFDVYHSTSEDEVSDSEAILVFSDWHYGMKTDNVFNQYNTAICRERVSKVVYDAISRIKLHSCNTLHIVVLGDISHGNIHTSARVASEELACDQLMQSSEILAQAIEALSGHVERTYVYTTYGNHMRSVQNKHDSIHRDNMERLVPWWLEQRLKGNERIIIVPCEDNEFLFVNSCGHEFCASHGDLDSVKSSPRLLATLFHKKYGKNIEYIILGDKHHRESFDELGVSAMICGSLCGTDDYANEKRLYSRPEQLLLIVNPECGADAEYRLKC